jgi:LPXTG-motif cell wall-anchored protein
MAHHTLITRLTCGSAAAGAAVFLVIASAGPSTAAEPHATNVLTSSLRFSPLSPTDPSSGHSLTRLVEMGVQTPSSDPTPAARSGHSLTRLVEMGVQTPSSDPTPAARSGHSLTRLVEMGVQAPSSDPTPAATSGHSLTRLVEMGVQAPSQPSGQRAAPGREDAATGIEAGQVALSTLGGVVLAGAWALARRRRRTPHAA